MRRNFVSRYLYSATRRSSANRDIFENRFAFSYMESSKTASGFWEFKPYHQSESAEAYAANSRSERIFREKREESFRLASSSFKSRRREKLYRFRHLLFRTCLNRQGINSSDLASLGVASRRHVSREFDLTSHCSGEARRTLNKLSEWSLNS